MNDFLSFCVIIFRVFRVKDAQRSKQFLPYLQRSGRSEGLVEFVVSGSRVRIYVPKETCIITFLFSGINCPRGARMGAGGKLIGESEPFAEEATRFTKSKILQHEVYINLRPPFEIKSIQEYLKR